MTLTLYNTLTRRKEPFRPIDPASVRMYVCGPTVYDYAHIGNARPIIVFDVLFRLLRHIYGAEHVTYARNITDVDDKINARAAEEGIDIRALTERTTRQFHADIAALGVLPPSVEPRATEHIAEMKRLCEELVARDHAYLADGHVLFDVASMPDYGRLANRSLEEMEAGARVEVAPYKKGPMDFVLWKPSKPGEPAWPSPCGIEAPGRPGWHLECSAMSDRWLWQEPEANGLLSAAGLAQPHMFDIHGGGIDLVFPHHENEIAQSRCAHGTSAMANVWMHNGFLQVEGEKMSKSLGNFVTINELLQEWPGEAIKLAMLAAHYRQPINWTRQGMAEAKRTLDHWYELTADAADGVALVRGRAGGAPGRSQHAAGDRGAARAALRGGQGHQAGRGLPQGVGAPAGPPAARCRYVEGVAAGRARHRRGQGGGADRRPQRRPQGQELQGGRPHPRRAGRHGHPAQGQQGPGHRRDQDDVGGEAVSRRAAA